jgi:predicted secreted hydrolase
MRLLRGDNLKKTLVQPIIGLTLLIAVIFLIFYLGKDEPQVQARLLTTPVEVEGFTQANAQRQLEFPTDHGAHPDFQTEWWYYTGNLQTYQGRHFGFQLTFFRRALLPPGEIPERPSNLSTHQVYMAHFTLTDVDGRRFYAFERLSRGAAGLAGAQSRPYRVWLENWCIEEMDEGIFKLSAAQNDITLDLILTDVKRPILHGDNGYSRKGPEPGNASHYISQTRLLSKGTIMIGSQVIPVNGLSWMDHEFSTNALATDQVGWDWFALQLDDGTDLMVFQIRKEEGSPDGLIDPYSSGTLVFTDGRSRHLTLADFEIIVHNTWRSPHSNAIYPANWTINIPSAEISLNIEPYLGDQELNLSFTYWEGAVKIHGEIGDQQVSGYGYAELTGYAGSMAGEF